MQYGRNFTGAWCLCVWTTCRVLLSSSYSSSSYFFRVRPTKTVQWAPVGVVYGGTDKFWDWSEKNELQVDKKEKRRREKRRTRRCFMSTNKFWFDLKNKDKKRMKFLDCHTVTLQASTISHQHFTLAVWSAAARQAICQLRQVLSSVCYCIGKQWQGQHETRGRSKLAQYY